MNPRLNLSKASFLRNFWVIFLTISFSGFSLAQDSTGWTSYVDLIYTDEYSMPLPKLAQCTAEAPDPLTALECYHNLEIIDGKAFEDCEADEFGDCGIRYGYPTPFWPEYLGEVVEDVYQEIYNRYYSNVWEYAFWELLPCGTGLVCEPTCVKRAIENILFHAYGSLNTVYWKEILIASLYYMNSNLWYSIPFPTLGGIVIPVFSYYPKPKQYELYADSIDALDPLDRGVPYTFTSPAYPNERVPIILPEIETRQGYPGLYFFEQLKGKLKAASLLEYMQFGFSTLFEAYGDTFTMHVFPLPCVFDLPIPDTKRAFTQWKTIPEGYEIPHTEDLPWVPSASVTDPVGNINLIGELLQDMLTASVEVPPPLDLVTPPPVTSATPVESLFVCPPLILADLATIDVLDNTALPKLPDRPSNNNLLIQALQYLLQNKMLAQYTDKLIGLVQTIGTLFDELGITGLLDENTRQALAFIQGKGNLPITGGLDLGTIGSLVSISCEGDEGGNVLALQSALNAKGFNLTQSGVFDAATKAAVMAFQEQTGLRVTGIADTSTWLALFS
jgi:Putative peptidoglycan binding domain